MNTYKFTGYVTKDYEILIPPHNGIYPEEDMEYHFLQFLFGEDALAEAKGFLLNHVCIQDGKLYANATVRHTFEERAEGVDEDAAEDRLLTDGDCMWKINRDHQGKPLIEIDDRERI